MLFHNLRSTRQTELAEKYPIHVVCQWIGNSRAIAQEHYLQVTNAHFADAVRDPAGSASQTSGERGQKAAQNPVHSLHAKPRKNRPRKRKKPRNSRLC
jgi:hypothetical protein